MTFSIPTDLLAKLTEILAIGVLVVGVLCVATSLISQLIKKVCERHGNKVTAPELMVIIIALVVTGLGFTIVVSLFQIAVQLYMILSLVFVVFLVAFVTMYGWDTFWSIVNKYVKKKQE